MTDATAVDLGLYHSIAAGGSASLALPARAVWRVTGADRVRYLNGQVTHDVARLAEGCSLYAGVLTGKGKLVGDLFVAAAPDALLLDAPLELRESLRERLEKFLIADDAEFADLTETGRLSHHFGAVPPPAAPGRIVSANPRFGPPGFDVWQEGPAPFLAGPEAAPALADLFRIEYGIGAWGAEIDTNTLPQEVLFDRDGRGLSYEKGCYVGQETVARIRSIGQVNRLLVNVEQVAGPAAEALPLGLHGGDGAEVARLTSRAFSPLQGREIGLALASRRFVETGGSLAAGERQYRITPPPRK